MVLDSSFEPSGTLYDPVRKQWVAATPEERVRQHALRWLIEKGGYCLENLIVEKALPLGIFPSASKRRLDIGYIEPQTLTHPGRLWLLIECKATLIGPLNLERAKRQLLGYQWELPSFALALVSDQQAWYGLSHHPETWMEGLPTLKELKRMASQTSNSPYSS